MDENSRIWIRIHWSEERIRGFGSGCGSVQKCGKNEDDLLLYCYTFRSQCTVVCTLYSVCTRLFIRLEG
jgi:hypothetical protein